MNPSSEFHFVCEISIKMKAAKNLLAEADLTAAIDPTVEGAVFVDRVVPLIDKYPFSYTELRRRVQKERPNVKQTTIDRVIREYNIKRDPSMSAYNFRTKTQEEEFKQTGILPKSAPSIYNDNAVRFIIEHVEV